MLTAAELTAIRDTADNTLDDTCTLLSGTLTIDAMGGGTMLWGTVATSVSCKVAPKSMGAPDATGGKISYHTDWTMHVAYDQAITAGQRVTFDSDTYQVVSVEDDHTWRTLRTAVMQRVE